MKNNITFNTITIITKIIFGTTTGTLEYMFLNDKKDKVTQPRQQYTIGIKRVLISNQH
jgi:hypothetical protein